MKYIIVSLLCLTFMVACSDNKKTEPKTGEEIRIEQIQKHMNKIKKDVVKFRKEFSQGEVSYKDPADMSAKERRSYEAMKTELKVTKKIIFYDMNALMTRIEAEKKIAQEKEAAETLSTLNDLYAQIAALKKEFK